MCADTTLDERNLDVLKELATIGVGHATGSLSALISHRRIGMEVPSVSMTSVQDLALDLDCAERVMVATWVKVKGDMGHVLLFMIPEASARLLAMEVLPESLRADEEMLGSALLEIGSIVAHSYLNAVSAMVKAPLTPEPPRMAVDMGAAIIGTVLGAEAIVDEQVVLISTRIQADDLLASGSVVILPSADGLVRLLAGAE